MKDDGEYKGQVFVYDLGTFKAPKSTFVSTDKTLCLESFQNESTLRVDTECDVLFASAGSVGGRGQLTVFNWSNKDDLTAGDFLVSYDDEYLGGRMDIAGAITFTENEEETHKSSSGCNSGLGFTALASLILLYTKKKR